MYNPFKQIVMLTLKISEMGTLPIVSQITQLRQPIASGLFTQISQLRQPIVLGYPQIFLVLFGDCGTPSFGRQTVLVVPEK